jgi:hypothetical protein
MNKNKFYDTIIDQVEYDLIGWQAFYEDGNNKFYDKLEDIEEGYASNPLVDVKQVKTVAR